MKQSHITIKFITDQLKSCATAKHLESWYASMIKTGTSKDHFLMNQFITACSNLHAIDSAVSAFAHVEEPNVFVYNAMIGASVNCSRSLDALSCYAVMLRSGVRSSTYTFPAVIKACRVLSDVVFGRCVHGQLLRNGLGLGVHVQTALLDFYSSFGEVAESSKVFEEMSERDHFAWSAMVFAYVRTGDLDSGRNVFDDMPEHNTAACNALIHGYSEAGDVESSEELFGGMVERDVISWTTMIKCYCKNKRYREGLELFHEMKSIGMKPDQVTMATVVSACAHLGALGQGKEMHLYIIDNGFATDAHIGSALVDMYFKCGMLERALVVFFNLPEKNIVCWSSAIDGLAVHGYGKEALVLFDKMVNEDIEPNGVVFVSLLAACTHAGLVEEGKKRFSEMTGKYSILPEIEHYGCMIDLLCRVGLLEEAFRLIKTMRVPPNAVVWGSLLSGCKLHKNFEIAEAAVDRLVILEPDNSGYFALVINMFAEANRWSEVARIRKSMKERRVEKIFPGSSWIEVRQKMHQFAAGGTKSDEIGSVLCALASQLKLFGHTHTPQQYDSLIEARGS